MWNHRCRQVIEVEPSEIGSLALLHKAWLGRPGRALEEEVHSPHMRFVLLPVHDDQWQKRIRGDCDAKLFLDFPGGCLMSRLMGFNVAGGRCGPIPIKVSSSPAQLQKYKIAAPEDDIADWR